MASCDHLVRGNHFKPISQYCMEKHTAWGMKDIVVMTNETKRQLIGNFGNGCRLACNFSYMVQENKWDEKYLPLSASDSTYHRGNLLC